MNGGVLDVKMKKVNEESVGDEQGDFRKGRGCVDRIIFGLKMPVKKYPDKVRKLFADFMDLEKTYGRVEEVAGG